MILTNVQKIFNSYDYLANKRQNVYIFLHFICNWYDYISLLQSGSISVQVYLLTQGQVYQEYYSGENWAGASTANWIKNNISINNSTTDIWSIPSTQYFSSYIIGAILAPVTGEIKFQAFCDDGWTIYTAVKEPLYFYVNYFYLH